MSQADSTKVVQPAQIVPFRRPAKRTAKQPTTPSAAQGKGGDCGVKQVLNDYDLAELISAVLNHPDLPDELGRAIHEGVLDLGADTTSPEYIRLALIGGK